MSGINGIAGGISSLTGAMTANQSAAFLKEKSEFAALMDSLTSQAKSSGINNETLSTSATVPAGRLNGDYTSGKCSINRNQCFWRLYEVIRNYNS